MREAGSREAKTQDTTHNQTHQQQDRSQVCTYEREAAVRANRALKEARVILRQQQEKKTQV
jgi:hypothetical protein